MGKQPFLVFFIALILGILFRENILVSELFSYVFLILSLLVLFLTRVKSYFLQKFKGYLFGLGFFCFGIFLHSLNSTESIESPLMEKSTSECVFILDKKLNSNENNRKYIITILYDDKEIKSVLSVPKSAHELDFKHIYKSVLLLNKPFAPSTDFQFDYSKYLARQNIYFTSYAPNEIYQAELTKMSFAQKFKQKRLEHLSRISSSELEPPVQNFLKGIVLSDRTEMDSKTLEDFTISGLMHFLAISGTHIVIIYWMIMQVLKLVFNGKKRIYGILISLVIIWIFGIYIGFGSSVLRSCLMITLYYGFVILQRKPDLLHSWSLAGVLILILDSQQFFDIGFQLSFLAVLGIFLFNDLLLKLFPKTNSKPIKFFLNVLTISTAAQLSTLPLVLFYFHQFSWMSFPANLLIVPASEIYILFSFIMTFLYGIGVVISPLERLYELLVNVLLDTIHFFATNDFAVQRNVPLTLVELILCYIVIFCLWRFLRKKSIKTISFLGIVILLFVNTRLYLDFSGENSSEVVFVSNYKEEIILEKVKSKVFVHHPEKSNLRNLEKFIVNPYLSSRRIEDFEFKSYKGNVVVYNNKTIQLSTK